jgi:nickel/cobalt transporter (NicO) family protein
MSVVAASVLGLGLGLKHAFEADHVAAVCTFVARGGTVTRAAWSGALWGLGHGAVMVLVGGALVASGATVPPSIALALDVAVAVMLIGLGIGALVSRRQKPPEDGAPPKTVKRPLLVGLVHGASGTAALTLLVASTMQARTAALVFVGVFGLASVLGMALIAALVAWPMRSLTRVAPSLGPRLQALAGLGSIAAGITVASTVF